MGLHCLEDSKTQKERGRPYEYNTVESGSILLRLECCLDGDRREQKEPSESNVTTICDNNVRLTWKNTVTNHVIRLRR